MGPMGRIGLMGPMRPIGPIGPMSPIGPPPPSEFAPPPPRCAKLMPFTALGLNSHLTKAIREAGYTEPTPIQSKAIPIAIDGKDLIGIAQTGTGKTAAFVLPILQRLAEHPASRSMSRALIVAPTRELVIQIEEATRKYSRHLRNVRTVVVLGGVGEQPQIAGLPAGAEIIIATPGRLLDLTQPGHVKLGTIP